MSGYGIEFVPRARRAWDRLDRAVRVQLAKKLAERQQEPRVPAARVRFIRDGYKIKARKAGIRLVYTIVEDRIVILVLAVASRAENEAYESAEREFAKLAEQD